METHRLEIAIRTEIDGNDFFLRTGFLIRQVGLVSNEFIFNSPI